METIKRIVEDALGESPCRLDVRYREPMSEHCTFRVGGPADCFVAPSGEGFPAFAASLLSRTSAADIPVFVLGCGANTVFADGGFPGIVLYTGGWSGPASVEQRPAGTALLRLLSGTSLDDAADSALSAGLSGLEFLAGMPGSIGGALWMNARCYGRDVAGVLYETEGLDFSDGDVRPFRIKADPAEFGYKRSPFQARKTLILAASFLLESGDSRAVGEEMRAHRRDREEKGHYRLPSAGSVFKNDPAFGMPTGKLIDGLGLRGKQIGGAQVAPWHGNIIVNTGGATASDIRALVGEISATVEAAYGFVPEPEILFVPGRD